MAKQQKQQFQALTPITYRDFIGINPSAAPYNLEDGELFEAIDVYVDRNGGICSRRTVTPFASKGIPPSICSMMQFESKAGDSYVIMQDDDGKVWHVKNGPGPVVASPLPKNENGRCCYVGWQVNDYFYMSNGNKVWKWDGVGSAVDVTTTTIHPLGDEQNVNNMGVLAGCQTANFLNTVFVAGPKINEVDPRAVYWSSPVIEYPDGEIKGQEDFSEMARFSFTNGAPSDEIVRLLPCGQNLLVIKSHSVHAVRANDNASVAEFFYTDVLDDAGIVGPQAVACELGTAFMFDQRRGVIMVESDGTTTQMFDQLFGLIEDKRIKNMKLTAMASHGRKLYVSLPLDSKEHNTHTFVYDFDVKGWVEYCIGFDMFLDYCPASDNSKNAGGLIGYVASENALVFVDDAHEMYDDFGTRKQRIKPSFSTKWFDHALPYIPKNFNSAEVTLTSAGVAELCVTPTYDWDQSIGDDTRVVENDGIPVVDQCPEFDDCDNVTYAKEVVVVCDPETMEETPLDCDGGPFYGPRTDTTDSVSLGKLNKGRAVQFRFEDNRSDAPWCIGQITMYYKPLSVKGC